MKERPSKTKMRITESFNNHRDLQQPKKEKEIVLLQPDSNPFTIRKSPFTKRESFHNERERDRVFSQ